MSVSLRRFIFTNLLVGELLATILGISTVLFLEHRDIKNHIHNELLESAFAMQDFVNKPNAVQKLRKLSASLEALSVISPPAFYQHIKKYFDYNLLRCYVWDENGRLLFGSLSGVPEGNFERIENAPLGFSEFEYHHETWVTFSTIDFVSKIKITSLQQVSLYSRYPRDLAREVIIVILTSYLFLGFLMWFILVRGLNILKRISTQVQQQGPDHLSPLDISNLPSEIKPLMEEWNKLFDRLRFAFDREKRFAADAAHELKTPLAALKTHTQLALNSTNKGELINALQKIVKGVDRSAHVVHQLLTLNRMNQSGIMELPALLNIVQLAKETIADLVPQALEKNTEIELIAPATSLMIEGYDTAIAILLRNLIDNAIRYSPEQSLVQVVIEESPDKQNVILKVIDNGRGIPEHLRQRVFERFFRVIGNKSAGSGLGLGIVQQIADLHRAVISLETPLNGHGLQVTILFSKKLMEENDDL